MIKLFLSTFEESQDRLLLIVNMMILCGNSCDREIQSILKQFFEIFLCEFSLADHKFSELIQYLIKLDIILVLGECLVISQTVPELPLAVQQLIQISKKQLQLANIAAFLVLADAAHKDLVDAFEARDKIPVHVLHLGVVSEQFGEMGVGMKVMVVPHEVLAQEDARIKSTAHLGVYFLGIVHQLLQLFRKRDHPLSQSRQQLLHEVEVFIELAPVDHHGLAFEVVEGHLEVDLLKLVHEALSLPLFVQFHLYATTETIYIQHYSIQIKIIYQPYRPTSSANCSTHLNFESTGTPKSVRVLLPQTSFTTSCSLQYSKLH